ncbi:protein VAPYRIN-like [Manihot esculenta]|uniref:protein VAPYRIN-like n=1 Tax=Manihot esculenta TaxID=3983 RepID=UPI001CC44A98|nr:protein VAPYRIN-like [Manihot esculenta]
MVNLLLEAGLKIDARAKADDVGFHQIDAKWQSKGWSELHVAIAFDRTDEVLDSLDSFGPLDLRDKEGRTPLPLAAGRGNIKCARVLVESGADKDAKSKDGRTALYRAAANGDHKMVEMLIEMGSDPTIADNHGRSAFDVARDKGHILETLERGEVVLMAARRGNLEHLESLLKKGANENYKDQYGFTALRAAAIKGHKDIVSMLVKLIDC